jgi:hypothetical protein
LKLILVLLFFYFHVLMAACLLHTGERVLWQAASIQGRASFAKVL